MIYLRLIIEDKRGPTGTPFKRGVPLRLAPGNFLEVAFAERLSLLSYKTWNTKFDTHSVTQCVLHLLLQLWTADFQARCLLKFILIDAIRPNTPFEFIKFDSLNDADCARASSSNRAPCELLIT